MSSIQNVDHIFLVKKEKKEGKGEDSFCYNNVSKPGMTLIGVFDGCGGAGAKQYPVFDNHTGAYMASRIVSGAVFSWFKTMAEKENRDKWTDQIIDLIKDFFIKYKKCDTTKSLVRGSLIKDFPTTMSCAILEEDNDKCYANFFWAGDSRGYILDAKGLHIITKDDVRDTDEMSNLKFDAPMINVISASKAFVIHDARKKISPKSIVLCATDGCFGYLPSPMHFEYYLLKFLMESNNIQEWKSAIDQLLADVSGDDYTMLVALYGYHTFNALKESLKNRFSDLEQRFILGWKEFSSEEQQLKWETYKREIEYNE